VPVQIDWSNPMTRGLVHYHLFPNNLSLVGGGRVVRGAGGYSNNRGGFWTSGGSQSLVGSTIDATQLNTFDGISVIAGCRNLDGGPTTWSMLRRDRDNWFGLYQGGGTGEPQLSVVNNNDFSASIICPRPTLGPEGVDFSAVTAESGRFAGSVNGSPVTTFTSFTIPAWGVVDGVYFGSSVLSTNANFTETLSHYCGVYNRALSDDELTALSSDPYQILIPA